MGLRSPAELATQAPDIAQMPNARFQEVKRQDIGGEYLKTISAGVTALEKAEAEKAAKMASIVKARARAEANRARLAQENIVSSTQGFDVLKVSEKSGRDLDKEMASIMGKYDDQYQAELQTVRMEVMNQFTRATQPYVVNQTKKATKDTFDAVIADSMNDAVLSSGSPEEFDMMLSNLAGTVREKSNVQHGYDEEAEVMPGLKLKSLIDSETKAAQSRTIRNGVGILVDGNQYSRAVELFERHRGNMNADDLQAAMKDLSKGLENQEDMVSASMARDLYVKHGDNIVAAREEALALSGGSTKKYEKVVKNFDDLVDSQKKQTRIDTENTIKSIYDSYDQGASWQSLQPELDKLPPKEKSELIEAYNKNGKSLYPNTTNDKAMAEAMDQVFYNFSEVERMEKQGGNFLVKYRTQLSPNDYATVQRVYQSKKAAGSNAQAKIQNLYDKMSMEAAIQVNNELNIADPALIAKSKRLAIEIGDSLVTQNPRIKESELREGVKRALFMQINPPQVKERNAIIRGWNSFWGNDSFTDQYYVDYGDPKNPNVPASPVGNSEKYTPEYVGKVRDQYRERLKRSGKQFTEQQLNDLINLHMKEGKL